MELIVATVAPAVIVGIGLGILAGAYPSTFRPIYRAYIGFWRWILVSLFRWLWTDGPDRRGGGRINIPDMHVNDWISGERGEQE